MNDTEKNETENETEEKQETETEIPASVAIVQAALDQNPVGVADVFGNEIKTRIADLVSARKQEIAKNLINPSSETETEKETETDEDNKTDVKQGDDAKV
jgi:hypothetical protein